MSANPTRARNSILFACLLVLGASAGCGARSSGTADPGPEFNASRSYVSQEPAWYATEQAIQVAERLVEYQQASGGWPLMQSNVQSIVRTMDEVAPQVGRTDAMILASSAAVRFLSRVQQGTGTDRFEAEILKGIDYLLAAQHANGGWPKNYPETIDPNLRISTHNTRGRYTFITFNDDSMAEAIDLMLDVAQGARGFQFVDEERRARARDAVERGVQIILKLQLVDGGLRTAWAQYFDELTLEPRWGRKFEPVSIASRESVPVVRFLMRLEDPGPEVVAAVQGAVAWFDRVKIPGIREEVDPEATPVDNWNGTVVFTDRHDRRIVADPAAPPLWAHFYEIGTDRPVFASEDDTVRYGMAEISLERRSGYDWYGGWANELLEVEYPAWLAKNGLTSDLAQQDSAIVWPAAEWERITPEEAGMDAALLEQARDYALTAGGSGHIVRGGKLVMSWGDPNARYDIKSATKSFGSLALLLALHDGKVRIDDPLSGCRPGLAADIEGNPPREWLEKITLFNLATQTAGFSKRGGFGELLFEPGTRWHYSDSGPNWLAECLTLEYGVDLRELMFERVFAPLGIGREDLTWRENSYRPHEIDGIKRREFGAGIHVNVDAMARFGLLHLRGGRWRDQQIVPPELVRLATRTHPQVVNLPIHADTAGEYGNAPQQYGLLWWTNADEALEGVPLDTYIAWGLYEGLVIVIPSLDLVISRAGPNQSWERTEVMGHYDVLKPFLGPIVESIRRGGGSSTAASGARAPYPASPVIRDIEWAPADEILRLAEGSDNWATTWGDDGALYTAYGDGWGFEPLLREKLSLGFARVEGSPPDLDATNIRSPTGEQRGGGAAGKKASGLLMVDEVLYMWARNAGNSQLAWSADRGKSWSWADWTFTTSFGAPTFLNFGPNYAGARDDFVYVYSHDNDSAYEPADRMVLARVPKDRIADRGSYEFFVRLDEGGDPVWSGDIAERGAVFSNPGRVYRSGIGFSSALNRYIWYQPLPGEQLQHEGGRADIRFEGGMGVYDAPEPWGPWTTAYFTDRWDVGPGESGTFPTSWMSPDGRTMHLVFSGDDFFSVREATLLLAEDGP